MRQILEILLFLYIGWCLSNSTFSLYKPGPLSSKEAVEMLQEIENTHYNMIKELHKDEVAK